VIASSESWVSLCVLRSKVQIRHASFDFSLRVLRRQTYLRIEIKYCQQNCQQRVVTILVWAVAEHEKIVSTNSVKMIISTLKITRSTYESYLMSQTDLSSDEARERQSSGSTAFLSLQIASRLNQRTSLVAIAPQDAAARGAQPSV
jgi:hypothetical protein